MVCDGAMVASTLVSMMMNGVCCVWQMQEEDERRDAIRKDIRTEYTRQRMMDMEYWQFHGRAYHSDTSLVEDKQHDRRRRLLLTKQKLHVSSNTNECKNDDPTRMDDVADRCPPPMVSAPPESPQDPWRTQRRVRSDPILSQSASAERRRRNLKTIALSGKVSSLMDVDNEDSDDELELFDVEIR